jgi:hypothetical protein
MLVIGLQPPYAILVGIDTYFDKEETKLGYKSFIVHLLVVTLDFRWDFDE